MSKASVRIAECSIVVAAITTRSVTICTMLHFTNRSWLLTAVGIAIASCVASSWDAVTTGIAAFTLAYPSATVALTNIAVFIIIMLVLLPLCNCLASADSGIFGNSQISDGYFLSVPPPEPGAVGLLNLGTCNHKQAGQAMYCFSVSMHLVFIR